MNRLPGERWSRIIFSDLINMSSSDSDLDDSVPLKRVSSLTSVPSDIDYKIKVKRPYSKSDKMLYTLKKGLVLPYTTNIEGL